jgi:hypothetical protein
VKIRSLEAKIRCPVLVPLPQDSSDTPVPSGHLKPSVVLWTRWSTVNSPVFTGVVTGTLATGSEVIPEKVRFLQTFKPGKAGPRGWNHPGKSKLRSLGTKV